MLSSFQGIALLSLYSRIIVFILSRSVPIWGESYCFMLNIEKQDFGGKQLHSRPNGKDPLAISTYLLRCRRTSSYTERRLVE